MAPFGRQHTVGAGARLVFRVQPRRLVSGCATGEREGRREAIDYIV